jgi:hypothetical protein
VSHGCCKATPPNCPGFNNRGCSSPPCMSRSCSGSVPFSQWSFRIYEWICTC